MLKDTGDGRRRREWMDSPRDRMKKLRLCQMKYRGAYKSDKSNKEGLTPEFGAPEEAALVTLG